MRQLKLLSPLFVVGLLLGNLAMAASSTVKAEELALVEESVNAGAADVASLQHHHHGHHGHHGHFHGHHHHGHHFHGHHHGHHGHFHGHHHHGHHGHHHHFHFFGLGGSAPEVLPAPSVDLK